MKRLAALLLLVAGCSTLPLPRRATYHPSDADLTVTRIVHGAAVLALGGTRVLIDPWFHSGVVTRQREPLGLTPEGLPPLDAVLVTHGHAGYFDARALRDLAASVPEVVAPEALGERLTGLGFRKVTILGWWDRTQVGAVAITAVPARHSVPENGYVLEAGGLSAYVAGDTRAFPELIDVATRFPALTVALLPVGGERLLGVPRAMGPADAARTAKLLGARRVIPVGYGARSALPLRWYARRPIERFVAAAAEHGIGRDRVVVLDPGESWHYYGDTRPEGGHREEEER